MKSVVVKYSKLESPIREKVELFLKQNDPEFINFPYKGKTMRGFIFDFKDCRYLIINDVNNDDIGYDDEEETTPADMADIEAGFDGEGEDEPDASDDDEEGDDDAASTGSDDDDDSAESDDSEDDDEDDE